MHEQARGRRRAPERLQQLDGGHAGTGDDVGLDAPDARHVGARVGVDDLAVAGELVALLAVLAPALPVALAGEGAVAAARAAGQAEQQGEVDRGRRGVGAVDVLLDPAPGEDVGALARREPAREPAER